MRNILAFGALVAAVALSATPLAAQDAPSPAIPGLAHPPMSAQDLVTLPRLGAPAVNAAGTMAVYSVTVTDPETLKRSPRHYLLDLTKPGAAPVEMEALIASDLAFGPDGYLYFLSDAAPEEGGLEVSRVWRMKVWPDGRIGIPEVVAGFDTNIAGFKLPPTAAPLRSGAKSRAAARPSAAPRPSPRTCPAPAPAGSTTPRTASCATGTAGPPPAFTTASSPSRW